MLGTADLPCSADAAKDDKVTDTILFSGIFVAFTNCNWEPVSCNAVTL